MLNSDVYAWFNDINMEILRYGSYCLVLQMKRYLADQRLSVIEQVC